MSEPTPATTPAAIVLCLTGTGMATVRTLADAGVDVHAFIFSKHDLLHYSRYAHKVSLYGLASDDEALLAHLINYAQQLGRRPVVLPTCDAHALLLAKHRERLSPYCLIWSNEFEALNAIVNKQRLYRSAERSGVPTVSSLYNPSLADAERWSARHDAPYLLKPPFEGSAETTLHAKNLRLDSREALLDYARCHGLQGLIVQRLIRGGDGHVFDSYGLCTVDGRALALASHRRLRQHLPDFGATCYGEIPSGLPAATDERLFHYTRLLLREVQYHGIFGIEWLHERGTDHFYLIDFNARPFSTIGHLHGCGINLPWLAYRELCGERLNDVPQQPPVKHKYWMDLDRDLQTARAKRVSGELTCMQWLHSLIRTRSFAYFNWRDPKPGLVSVGKVLVRLAKFVVQRLVRRRVRARPRPAPDVAIERVAMRQEATAPAAQSARGTTT